MAARTIRALLVCDGRTAEGRPCSGRREVDGWPELRNPEARELRKCPTCSRPMRVARTTQVEKDDGGET